MLITGEQLLECIKCKCEVNTAAVCAVIKMCSVVNDELMLDLF